MFSTPWRYCCCYGGRKACLDGAIGTKRDSGSQRQSGGRALAERHRLRWCAAVAAGAGVLFAFPRYLGFGTEVLITVLFAISLDLALGSPES